MKPEMEKPTLGMSLLTSELMTENELIQFLRIPEISRADDYHNVIEHLKRMRNLPRIQLCNKVLYPTRAILDWVARETVNQEE